MSGDMSRRTWPIQVDPPGCGCTECITGEYVPLDLATLTQVADMIQGGLGNGTPWGRDQWLLVTTGTGKVIRIVHPLKNDELLDALREQDWRIK